MALRTRSSKLFVTLILVVIILLGGGLYLKNSNSTRKLDRPEYLSFVGNYVFSIPTGKVVDEQAIAGMQLVYTGSVIDKTLDEIYAANNIGVQPIASLKDHKAASFKNFVNDTFVPGLKKSLASDIQVTFAKANGWDEARITVKKDNQPLRFIYLKNGQHPVAVLSKEETPQFMKIEDTITDVEKTDLKREEAPLKKAIQNNSQLMKDQKATDLYNQATPDLRDQISQDQFIKAIKTVEVYTQGQIVINGGSYNNSEFSAVVNFAPLNKDFAPASGVMFLKKVDGQWKVKNLILPNPKPTNKQ